MKKSCVFLILLSISFLWAIPSEKCVTKGMVECGTLLSLPLSCCHVFCPSYGEKLLRGDCAPTWYCPNIEEFFARERKVCPTRQQFEAEQKAERIAEEKRRKEKEIKKCKEDEQATRSIRKAAKKKRDLYEKQHGGSFVDSRDGRKYKTITIGNQEWMAENLNYESDDSYCPEEKKENCQKYGRLYSSSAAISGKVVQKKGSLVVQGLCPDGWHLPTSDEFGALLETVGGYKVAAAKLTSSGGWGSCGHEGGTDDFAFSIVQSGSFDRGYYHRTGSCLWYATDYKSADCWKFWYGYLDEEMSFRFRNDQRSDYNPIRCLKDSEGDAISIDSSFWDSQEGMLTDYRDMNTYRTTRIDNQIWMAENLKYEAVGSVCAADNCEKYGFLYAWGAAMDSAGGYSANGKDCGDWGGVVHDDCLPIYPVRGICPKGWHLPTENEFKALIDAAGGGC